MASTTWNLERLRREGSYWRSRVLITAAHLDLFSWIGKGEKSFADIASHFGGDPAGWEIFLNSLCGMGLIRKRGKRYANSRFSLSYLSCGRAAFLLPAHDDWNIWGKLSRLLTTGKRPKVQEPFFTDRKRTGRLLHALHLDGLKIAPYLIRRLPLARSRTLLDLGGGYGTFALAFCRRFRRLRATLIEHPSIVPLARRAVREAGLAKRVRVIGMDFLREALPHGFDTIFVSNVLHGQGASENRSLLGRIHRCLNPKGQLILRDVFMSRGRTRPEWATVFSVLLFLHTPKGRCYALEEIRGWLLEAGFLTIRGPFPSSPLPFDPDSVLIAEKSRRSNNSLLR